MALPATTEATLLTTEDDLPVSVEFLLTLTPAEASHEVINGTGVATLHRWVTILDTVRAGYPLTVAAVEIGCPLRTLRDWMHRGRNDEYPYNALVEAVELARAVAEKQHLSNVFHAAFKQKNWTASAWYLERTRGYTREQKKVVDDSLPKEFTIIIDQSGKIAERAAERADERKAITVKSRVADD